MECSDGHVAAGIASHHIHCCCSTLTAVQSSNLQEFPERVVMAVSCDVSKPKDVQALVGKAARELGRIVSGAGREGFDEAASLHAGWPVGSHSLRQLGL